MCIIMICKKSVQVQETPKLWESSHSLFICCHPKGIRNYNEKLITTNSHYLPFDKAHLLIEKHCR